MKIYTYFNSPIGPLLLLAENNALIGLYMGKPNRIKIDEFIEDKKAAIFIKAKKQLEEYFSGNRLTFNLPLQTVGTNFQQKVWSELQKIPYGKTISYGELARRIKKPLACRAVGLANNRNPISVIIPCHRVIGANGSLTGYGGGLNRKESLLDMEAKFVSDN